MLVKVKRLQQEVIPLNGLPYSGPFSTVVVDPPWCPVLGDTWESRTREKHGAPQTYYPTLSLHDIVSYKPYLAKQAHLYVWGINAHIDWACQVIQAWGGETITLLTWKKSGLGTGRFRCNTEHIVVGRVGSRIGNPFGQGGRTAQATKGTLFEWPRGRHSQKPDEFYHMVEQMSPSPRLDMYARTVRAGWYVWGEEVSK